MTEKVSFKISEMSEISDEKKNLHLWMGILHWAIAIFLVGFPLFIKGFGSTLFYLTLFFVVVIHWTYLSGECFISFLMRRHNNPDYQPGQNIDENVEMSAVTGKENYDRIMKIGLFVYGLIVFFVLFRNNEWVPTWFSMAVVLTYFFYIYALYQGHGRYPTSIFYSVVFTLMLGMLWAWALTHHGQNRQNRQNHHILPHTPHHTQKGHKKNRTPPSKSASSKKKNPVSE